MQNDDINNDDPLERSKAHLLRLHEALSKGLADKAESGEMTPAEMKEARQLLSDNRVRAVVRGRAGGGPRPLSDDLPFIEDDDPRGGAEYQTGT
jgi:hypothetical protein